MKIGYKQNVISFFSYGARMFIMLTPNADWNIVMTSYNARNNVETAFDILKSEFDEKRVRTGDPI